MICNYVVIKRVTQVDIPNAVHAFQTAERIRQVHPNKDWFQLTGLIHDIGKVMSVWGEPQVQIDANQVVHTTRNVCRFQCQHIMRPSV